MMATQWEYKVICLSSIYGRTEKAEKELNAAGSDGWEAVAAWGDDTGASCHVILKRPKSK
jgi:hypothetical protein